MFRNLKTGLLVAAVLFGGFAFAGIPFSASMSPIPKAEANIDPDHERPYLNVYGDCIDDCEPDTICGC